MTFLEGNSFVSGSRWRCRACEAFLSWRELEYCGYTAKLLKEFADRASPKHDRIEISSDGQYRLLDERQSRTGKKRKILPTKMVSVGGETDQKKAKVMESLIDHNGINEAYTIEDDEE